MYLNVLISALITIFFLGKATKEEREKTERASGLRVIIFGVLTIVSFVIFYKSYQVATIYNYIQIDAVRASHDSIGKIVDYVDTLEIKNRFGNGGTYNNDIIELVNKKRNFGLFEKTGGLLAKIKTIRSGKYPVKDTEKASNFVFNPYAKNLKQSFGLIALCTDIPSFFPFYPQIDSSKPLFEGSVDDQYLTIDLMNTRGCEHINFYDYIVGDTCDISDLTILNNGYMAQGISTSYYEDGDDSIKDIMMHYEMPFVNSLNIFTAADISQYTYALGVNSDLDINKISISYDLPIEIANPLDGLKIGTTGFDIDYKKLRHELKNTLFLHVKLPTMYNLQLIRSFILTGILTVLFSLFSTNFYYWLRKRALKYKSENKLKLISQNKIKHFENRIKVIVLIISAILLYYIYLIYNDMSILVELDKKYHVLGIVILFFVLVILFVFLSYIQFIEKEKKDNKNDSTDEIPTIFVHESEDDEVKQFIDSMKPKEKKNYEQESS